MMDNNKTYETYSRLTSEQQYDWLQEWQKNIFSKVLERVWGEDYDQPGATLLGELSPLLIKGMGQYEYPNELFEDVLKRGLFALNDFDTYGNVLDYEGLIRLYAHHAYGIEKELWDDSDDLAEQFLEEHQSRTYPEVAIESYLKKKVLALPNMDEKLQEVLQEVVPQLPTDLLLEMLNKLETWSVPVKDCVENEYNKREGITLTPRSSSILAEAEQVLGKGWQQRANDNEDEELQQKKGKGKGIGL